MKRIGPLVTVLVAAVWAVAVMATAATSASAGESHPFNRKANSAALKAKIAEEFPGAEFPAKEGTVCSPDEHSPNGPPEYCFVEFTTGSTWNIAEAAMTIDLVGGTGVSTTIYSHTTWQRRWKRCSLRRGVPGKLFSNDDCGSGQPEQPRAELDGDIVEFEALPRIERGRPLHWVSRGFIYSDAVSGLARYRVSRHKRAYVFTNAFGDAFRYQPANRQGEPAASSAG
jgi:hypothetical protein